LDLGHFGGISGCHGCCDCLIDLEVIVRHRHALRLLLLHLRQRLRNGNAPTLKTEPLRFEIHQCIVAGLLNSHVDELANLSAQCGALGKRHFLVIKLGNHRVESASRFGVKDRHRLRQLFAGLYSVLLELPIFDGIADRANSRRDAPADHRRCPLLGLQVGRGIVGV
jgi:hypothetical protein